MSEEYRVSLAFNRGPQSNTIEKAGTVQTMLFAAAAFPTPPVSSETLHTAISLVNEAIYAQQQGGTEATAIKNLRLKELRGYLKQLATYVQMLASNDLPMMLSSGFDAISNNRASEQLLAPVDVNATFGLPGSVIIDVKAVKNARSYETAYALIDEGGNVGEWMAGPPSTSSRGMIIGDLVSGQLYAFRVRAVGGSTGVSAWSNTTSQRAY